jgi:death on curing protein
MAEPRWIKREALQILHDESVAEHGGLGGLRDEGMLESALARPVNLHLYEGCLDIARLAASYGFGLARNHPFHDGNKRAAFLAVGLFLGLNGQHLMAGQIEAYEAMIHVADGTWSEEEFAGWLRKNAKAR